MKGRDLTYSGLKLGDGKLDIRERKKQERDAELALAEARALREAAEENEARAVDRHINVLVTYKDALVSNSTQRQGPQIPLHSRKRERSRSLSSSPPGTPSPSPSRSTVAGAERRRATVRAGKGKDRRASYSRSPSPIQRTRVMSTPVRSIPGLTYREDRSDTHLSRRRERTPYRSPARRPSPGTPPGSPAWQVATSRRRRERR